MVAPVVAIGEGESVNVPLVGRLALADELVSQLVGRADFGTAALARVVEGVLVDQLSGRVVDDVSRGDALVMGLDPGINPKGLDAHDFLLFVHRKSTRLNSSHTSIS